MRKSKTKKKVCDNDTDNDKSTDLYTDTMKAFGHKNVQEVPCEVILNSKDDIYVVCWNFPLGAKQTVETGQHLFTYKV